jgi:ABC-type nickel/cobalt efflux system permease component RcnA
MEFAVAGFIAGLGHVLAGPDHLAAVAPFAVRGHRRAVLLRIRWGLGHAGGVALVALLALLLREVLPVEQLSEWSERAVGIVLVVIGYWGLRTALRGRLHAHEHEHEGDRHIHVHVHDPTTPHDSPQAHVHTHHAFGVGTLHGLAGSSHFLGVLPALLLPTKVAAGAYVAAFGLGSILAMAVFSGCIGLVAGRATARSIEAYNGLLGLCSVAAVGIGIWWFFGGA